MNLSFVVQKKLSMIATKTREESQIKFWIIKKGWEVGVFLVSIPPVKKRCYDPEHTNVFCKIHRDFAIFLRTPCLQNTSGGCF